MPTSISSPHNTRLPTNLLLLLLHPPNGTHRLILTHRPLMLMSLQIQLRLPLPNIPLRPHRILALLVGFFENGVHGFEFVAVGLREEPENDGDVHVVEAHEDEVGLPGDFVDHYGGELDDAVLDKGELAWKLVMVLGEYLR